MANPYEQLPDQAFWKPAVADRDWCDISGMWMPKWDIGPDTKIATFGSCFAQHFSRALTKRGFCWLNCEALPQAASDDLVARYNYNIYSARTGNIYTVASLRQWLDWAFGKAKPPQEIWAKDGRAYDPFRPMIEPDGFADKAEVDRARQATLKALRLVVKRADLLVFTLGLTEGWENASDGHIYAMCPGTAAGDFDPEQHRFVNYDAAGIARDLDHVIGLLRTENPLLKLLLTVSPVPLTATASGKHVLTATTYSKSVLRGAAGEAADRYAHVDYFPSYEIITAPVFGGRFFADNQRSVTQTGVNFVMSAFFDALAHQSGPDQDRDGPAAPEPDEATEMEDDLVCEEVMLEAFADRTGSKE